ncbi:unnamed protein product [Linum tenue]|uniref:Major facilitator superfamily domain-containing protein 12-like n=1 Tax=Linum tenue TaxID=586396 RepID=A0AAV0NJI3_9ROSI|nr:unnamed protein product [Linum tenue]
MGDNEIGDEEDLSRVKSDVGRWPVFYYGVGHMLNDITSSCWFTYLLLFLADIGLSPRDAAIVMLSGQVADGFATVFTGELIDRFGRFKVWHGAGSVLVAVSFSSVFGGCLPCRIFSTCSSVVETTSYSVSAAIFNMGWAAAQVSHMSMVNCISLNSTSRVVLTSCRNAFTMVANLSLYAIALVVFSVITGKSHADIQNQAYLAFYVIQDLRMAQSAKALVPAILYISSFVVSIMMQEVSWTGRRLKAYFSIGGILWIFCGASIILLPSSMKVFMYVISAFIGVANALMMVTAVSMQSVLVGSDLNGCAFVYGSLSFLDKISCGIALYVLQSFQSGAAPVAPAVEDGLSSSGYVSVTRYGLGLVPAVSSLVGVGVTLTMKLHTHSGSLTKPLLE